MVEPLPPGNRVLVVEDDRGVRESLQRALRLNGFEVETAATGPDGLASAAAGSHDVLVLDIMLPGIDGLEVCRCVRRLDLRTPILILTARHEVADRVAGLDAGADDYLVKPFALDELLARLRALLRRTSLARATSVLTVADLVVDPLARTARRGDRALELTKTEFDLLELLTDNVGIVLTRDVIYDRIWGFDFETTSRSLDVYVGYLRRKTEAGGEVRLLHTVRGVGYSLRMPTT